MIENQSWLDSPSRPLPRRVPGSGLRQRLVNGPHNSQPTPAAAPLDNRNNRPARHQTTPIALNRPSFGFKPAKHWRHVVAVGLLLVLVLVGFESQPTPTTASASNQTTNQAINSSQPPVSLPTIASVVLPPIPIKNSAVKEPNIPSASAILVDDATKTILFQKNAEQVRDIASTTKTITAMVAVENYPDLNQEVAIPSLAVNQIGSVVGYKPGEHATIDQLLHGMLLVSGNDAAMTLATLMAQPGDPSPTARFVAKMNEKAKALGMTNSHFNDPAGLDDQNGHSTALDMSYDLSAIVDNPIIAPIMRTADYDYNSPEDYHHSFKNSSRLVTDEMHYDGILVSKTGFTPETPDGSGAGHCMVSVAERNGHRLVSIILGTYSSDAAASADASRQLLDYGFNNFAWQKLSR